MRDVIIVNEKGEWGILDKHKVSGIAKDEFEAFTVRWVAQVFDVPEELLKR